MIIDKSVRTRVLTDLGFKFDEGLFYLPNQYEEGYWFPYEVNPTDDYYELIVNRKYTIHKLVRIKDFLEVLRLDYVNKKTIKKG